MSSLYFEQPRIHEGAKLWKKRQGVHLEQVRDNLLAIQERMDPIDAVVPISALHLDYAVLADFLAVCQKGTKNNGILGVSKSGYRKLCERAGFPGHMGSNLMHLAKLPMSEGAKVGGKHIASMAAGSMLRGNSNSMMIRTAKDLNNGQRYIRSAHSDSYGILDHITCIDTLLDSAASEWPVIDFMLTEKSFRCRQLVLEEGQSLEDIDLTKWIPSVQTRNSETGDSSFYFGSGGWRATCMNGMYSWNPACSIKARHRGDFAKLQEKIEGGIDSVMAHALGFFEAYDAALETSIQDAFAWFEREASGTNLNITNGEKENVVRAMQDPTSGNFGLLTNVFDAVTLAAQESIDEFRQSQLEDFGASLLRRGLSQAEEGRIPVLIEA